ncbi:T9SS type A sorting domain-containing protein [Maribellus comscasis]|uniref:T9SS type A sorting domain-containing protein n=1 Tax=Maribellus comscasis TaxID=2681766 RepID=A0A6I6JWH7_9BACT|nr:GLUG motif-containing protein [Maribellus comscasis]QGY44467.1 T9SS type A sorting domain-containing protein [Maribellus comscasis]
MKILPVFFIASLIFIFNPARAQYAGGDGTVDNPWQIATISQLNSVRNNPGDYFELINDLDFTGSIYDSINSTTGWSPIGDPNESSTFFSGYFNGKGHVISGLYINQPNTEYIGLFSYIKDAIKIDSVIIEDCNITGKERVGGLIGRCEYTEVSNCYISGKITGEAYVGGLVGQSQYQTLSNSFSNVEITGESISSAGGIVGLGYEAIFRNCSSTGNITMQTSGNAGGLLGAALNCEISNCYSNINIISGSILGGLIGSAEGSTISDCYATGNIFRPESLPADDHSNTGGFIGEIIESTSVTGCYSTGVVTGNNSSGGFIGYIDPTSTIANSYFNSESSGREKGIGENKNNQSVTALTTAQMKQQSSFQGFDFSSVWTINDGVTFPCFNNLDDNPIILDLLYPLNSNEVNTDTIDVVQMDVDIDSIYIVDYPQGMTVNNNIFSWIPNSLGNYYMTVVVKDLNGTTTSYKQKLTVVSYKGSGTVNDPYQIRSVEQLDSVRNFRRNSFILMTDLDYTGYDNSDEGWSPIGSLDYGFSGNFYGNGHTISNLRINREASDQVGLFGAILDATIDDLSVNNIDVSGNNDVGGIAGYLEYSDIINCHTSGNLNGIGNNIGGIAGKSSSSTIEGSNTIGKVSGEDYLGGLCGYSSETTISQCYADGNLNGNDYLGGLTGYNLNSAISNCYATGSVSGDEYVAGLSAYNENSNIYLCYSTGYVKGCYTCTAGLVGGNPSGSITNNYYNKETSGYSDGYGSALTTEEMKQQSSFTGFDFNSIWTISDGQTFPRLQNVYNNPIILGDSSIFTRVNYLYSDTLSMIPMDNDIDSVYIEDFPEGMTLNNQVISWIPDSLGTFYVTICAKDSYGAVTKYNQIVQVIPFGGKGTAEDPYQITNLEGLDYVRNFYQADYILMNDLDFSGSAWSSENSAMGWEPIKVFTGSFNGKAYTISNLYINLNASDSIGLFGRLSGASIDSLSISNIDITGDRVLGGLAGYVGSSKINNCNTSGEINGGYGIGGLCGKLENSTSISYCSSSVNLGGDENIGGIVGSVGLDEDSKVTISKSHASGDIKGREQIGGLVGYSSRTTISQCYASGNIQGTDGGIDTNIGGLVGYLRLSQVEDCFAIGNVNKESESYVGGLVGYCDGSSVTDCYATGNVTGELSGGLIGGSDDEYIAYPSEEKQISTVKNCYAIGEIKGTSLSGGVIGRAWSTSFANNYFNLETTGQTKGYGYADTTFESQLTGLTTQQMKQQGSFSGFSFVNNWDITNGKTFPRLKNLYDYPIVLGLGKSTCRINNLFTDTIQSVPMDFDISSFFISDYPAGMTLSYSTISWTPDSLGNYNFNIWAEDSQGTVSRKHIQTIKVFPFQGEGSEEDPFQITNLQELDYIRNFLDSYYVLMNDLDFSGSAWCADSSASGWEPISTFTGSFNGNGHTISNLYINRNASDSIGLFGRLSGASIDSLSVSSVNITGNGYLGGLAGYVSGSTIKECNTSGEINGSNENIGGLCGKLDNYATVSNCYSTVNTYGGSFTGGLVGYNLQGTIRNCYATGYVNGDNYVGGLVGYNDWCTINGSYFYAENSQQNSGIGYDKNSQTVTGLTNEQMKQQGSFPGFDFTNIWEITSGKTFPRLKNIYDSPVILDFGPLFLLADSLFKDTVPTISMDYEIDSLYIEDYPEGMVLTDSVISWRPEYKGSYYVDIYVKDSYKIIVKYKKKLEVISLQGSGTTADPFQIWNLEDLNLVREFLDSHFILMNDLDFSGSAWCADSSASGWEPISTFTGSFNGNGHTISNLYINRDSSDSIGLFGRLSGAKIDSLSISNVDITGRGWVGGLAGFVDASEISNCNTSGEINGSNDNVGGLCGKISNSSLVSNCYSTVNTHGGSYTGGLVGYNLQATIRNCYATGDVSGEDNIGGLIGENYFSSDIYTCYTTGDVSGGDNIGGLIGENNHSNVYNCYAFGDITGNDAVGGLVGYFGNWCDVTWCYSYGVVTGNTSVGALVGYNYNHDYSDNRISESFFNKDNNGSIQGVGEDEPANSLVYGLTEEQMKDQSFFLNENWDFVCETNNGTDYIWAMNDSVNNGAPFLKWQGYPYEDEPPVITSAYNDTTIFAGPDCEVIINDYTQNLTYTENCDQDVDILQIPLPGTLLSIGTTEVTIIAKDGSGNADSTFFNIMVMDTIAPIPDVSPLADYISVCSVIQLPEPTATDNCAGTITGTHDATLPITAMGTTVVTWSYDDGNGNTSTQIQNVIVVTESEDNTPPVPNLDTLADITAECEVSVLTPPTATDNCAGTVIGTHDATLPITTQGTTIVTWTYDDSSGNTSTQTQNVVIDDATAPVPDNASLADVTAECEVTSLTAPTATDNCAGTVTGTHDATLPITTQGTTIVTWTYDDSSGNTSTQTQNVVIDDATAPVPDNASLADVTAECEVTSLTAPTATDNCAGTVTGTHDATLPITTQGTTIVTWTYDDSSGNTSTQTQNVVIDDATAPVPDNASLADVTAECEVTSLTAPTATDNCAGTITGTHDATLPITTQGTTLITWTYDDSSGNTSTQTQNVVIDDATAPVPDSASLADVTAECEVTSLTAPTATDNCAGTVTGTHDAILPITTQGTTLVTWTYDDSSGNTSTQTQNVVIDDATAPVPDNASLADVTAECEVTSLTAPTATDNCAGTVTGTHDATLPITTQGTTIVTWTYDDSSGNTSTQTQNVVIDDATAPVPDSASLADVTAECEVTSLTAPTATDNCVGTVIGTHDATLPITTMGTTIVTWTYDDSSGNTSTQTQNVVIDDATAPVPDNASLADVTAECEVTSLTAPTATDNCAGTVIGTHDATLPITTQGTTIVTWTYDDGNGNTSTQTQNVVIDDATAPVPDNASLADVTAECEVTILTAPTATDNCAGTVIGTHDATSPITTQGTTLVTWTYDDGNGNTSTQTQNVVIDDATAPVPDNASLADVTAECEVTSLTAPTATDNCAGTVIGTHDATLPITTQGTTIVTWTYDDSSGNTSTQTQNVVIDDVTAPVADVSTLSDVTAECEVTSLTAPTATDNCAGTVTGTHDATLPITTQGTTMVTWTYEDGNGNTSTQTQNVIIHDTIVPSIICVDDQIFTTESGDSVYIVRGDELDPLTVEDNCSIEKIENSFNYSSTLAGAEFPAEDTIITWTVTDAFGNSSTCSNHISVDYPVGTNEISAGKIKLYPNPAHDIVYIQHNSLLITNVLVFDMAGKIVLTDYSPSEINVHQLIRGIYILKINLKDDEAVYFKLIKE